MNFGYFDDSLKEYVITTPTTPLPWINYLGCEDFYSLISNTNGGYSFYKDARLLRLTRYRYNNVPTDTGGHYFYIKDGNTVWNPGWQPSQTPLDEYTCRHGLGYSRFQSKKNGIKAGQLVFVPLGDSCEITSLTLTNESSETRVLDLFSYVEFCLWNAMDDMTNFQRNLNLGEVEVSGSTIYHKTEYRERRNHYAIYHVNDGIQGFDTDRDSFLGPYRGANSPQVIEEGESHNSIASGWSPIASHHLRLTLKPQESRTFIFLLGYIENPREEKWESENVINKKPAEALISRYDTTEKVDEAFLRLREHWEQLLSQFQVTTKDQKLNRMVNIWNQYQCMVTFNMSRSASYYESGIGRGMGFRDSCQDLFGFVHLIPHKARQRILDIAATQFEDGSAYHQYQPLTKKGNSDIGSGFNDDPLWLIAATAAYLKETGDFSLLEEGVPFNQDASKAQPLMEHLTRSFHYTLEHLGPHKLPLIGRADWNDCLNLNCFSETPGESFQTCANYESDKPESIFIAAMFVHYGKDYAKICDLIGRDDEAALARKAVDDMYDAVIQHGWDGDWFLRAYDAFGDKVGSKECQYGQIFIEPQGFCVLAEIGIKEGLAKKALTSVEQILDTKYGTVLLQPAYQEYDLRLGEITSYPPGYKENAGIFCHNNPWISIAETVLEQGDKAFASYSRICPAYLEDISHIHRTEPYVYAQMIAGKDAPNFGEAKNSWLTGTASWAFINISQYILGIRPDYGGLSIRPCLPEGFGDYEVNRRFRDADYNIKFQVSSSGSKHDIAITVDGEQIEGYTIPYVEGKSSYDILVTVE